MAAGSVVPFCKFADVVKIVSPMADSLKVVIIDIAAGYLSLLAAFCKIPNLVAVLYSEQLFVFACLSESALRAISWQGEP